MQPSQQNFNELIQKLDAFIRKFYTNQLIRGGIYAFTLMMVFFLAFALLESFAWFSTTVRSVLFYIYLLGTTVILGRLVIIPLLKLNRLGKIISHNEAASIVGTHFPHIQDKLLNTLQLHNLTGTRGDDIELINASINQKSAELRPIPFTNAIDLRGNRKYLRFAAIPAVIFLVMIVAAPSLITDPTKRLLAHNTYFSKPAPFRFNITQKKLRVTQFEDFTVNVKLSGKEIPQEVYLVANGAQYRLDKDNTVSFHYTFRNVQSATVFRFLADGYSSDDFTLEVVPNPLIVSFGVDLDYPEYLGKKDESLKNTGDLILPVGTKIKWHFTTQNTSSLKIRFNDSTYVLNDESDEFIFNRRVMNTVNYSIRTSNRFMDSRDSMQYNIMVIPDQHPAIEVEENKDETSYQRIYFRGLCRDDYGLSRLQFRYRFIRKEGQEVQEDIINDNISIKRSTQEQFYYYWDLSAIGLKPGDELEYYFEVWDNDGVHGAKSSRSQSNIFKAPSLNEMAKDAAEKNKATKDDLAESLKKAQELQKEMSELEKDILNKKQLGYEDRKKIADILKKQKELQNQVEELKKANQENMQRQQELNQPDIELAQKQQELQKLFDQLMSPEMKAKMEELERLMTQLDKKEVQEMVDKMKLDNKDLEKQLDRTLELFKQMELEQKMKETAEQLDQLAKKQEELSQKSEEKKSDSENLKDQQEQLGKEFDEIQKELDDIEKKNEELEYSQDLEKFDEDQESIEQDMKQSEQELSENKPQKASKSQKSAGDKMKQLSQKIKQNQQQQQEEQNEEDEQALRALLENLLRFSFDQEKLMEDLKTMDINNPRYLKLAQEQRKLKEDAQVLEDSLLALSKRVMQISSAVNEQITDINDNVGKAIDNLQDRQVPMARANQQYIMTAVNNLALMLSESLDQMQQQMAASKPSNGECKKPGKSKPGPSAGDVKKMQEKLGQQLQEMKEKLKNGTKPGGEKEGQKGKSGEGSGMSEELARMAAQQEALRNALNQLNQQENKDGTGKLGDLQKIMQQMEENEKDIVNKRISDMTMKRQQEIITRLLESEKAERQREEEQRRESNEARDMHRNPPAFEEYKKLQLKETELLKTIPPGFTGFYKNLVNSYFQSLEE